MVKETQRFGDLSVSFFRWNAAVRTDAGGSFGQRQPLYLDSLQTKPLSKWATTLDCPFPSV